MTRAERTCAALSAAFWAMGEVRLGRGRSLLVEVFPLWLRAITVMSFRVQPGATNAHRNAREIDALLRALRNVDGPPQARTAARGLASFIARAEVRRVTWERGV